MARRPEYWAEGNEGSHFFRNHNTKKEAHMKPV